MTREQAQSVREIFNSYCDGEEIQFRTNRGEWERIEVPSFAPSVKYRIKPKPRKAWVAEYEEGELQIEPTREDLDDRWHIDGRIATYEIDLPPIP